LLKEKRQTVISHAVTKGLNPVAPMTDSGIEWLGKIPRHWGLKRFGYISAVVRGASPRPAGDGRYFDGDFIPWITVGDLTKDQQVYLTSTESMLTQAGAEQSRVIPEGTLVLSNSGATLGVPKILSLTGCANDGVLAFLDLDCNASKQFLYYYLTSLTENLRDRVRQGSGQPNLNTDIVKALPVPWPGKDEQVEIAGYVSKENLKLDELTTEANRAIDLLQERRTALISAAVTGKIDVRGRVETTFA
jgi:type I restriction enzyme S subunit